MYENQSRTGKEQNRDPIEEIRGAAVAAGVGGHQEDDECGCERLDDGECGCLSDRIARGAAAA